MTQFSDISASNKFIVFIIGPMGEDKDSRMRRILRRLGRRAQGRDIRPEDRGGAISSHTRNMAEAASASLRAIGLEPEQFEVYYPDQLLSAGIVNDVFARIDEADFAIADITNRSANVFYEIAYFNALGTPMIILDGSKTSPPFYWAQTRVSQLSSFDSETIRKAIQPAMEAHLRRDDVNLKDNPISQFYGAPLVDVSAASGVAVGFFNNFAYHILVKGGVLDVNPGVNRLVVIKPGRINDLTSDEKRVQSMLAGAQDPTLPAPTHPRGAVRVKVLGDAIVDFPTPLYALVRAPRYRRLLDRLAAANAPSERRDAAAARMERKLIDAYFDTLDALMRPEGNLARRAFQIADIEDFARDGLPPAPAP